MTNQKIAARLEKFRTMFAAMAEAVKRGDPLTASISAKNTKMGRVVSVSLLPYMSCPAVCMGTCAGDCYAAKLAALRPSVLKSYAKNQALLMYQPEIYWQAVRGAVAMARYFRFHVSGDIINREYFDNMVRCAVDFPGTEILAFTKRFDVVNAWISENGELPHNLHIMFSGWENLKPENPHNLPETNVIMPGQAKPESWHLCGGNCEECAIAGAGCWAARPGETIAFNKH
jgi:hypothetical protein